MTRVMRQPIFSRWKYDGGGKEEIRGERMVGKDCTSRHVISSRSTFRPRKFHRSLLLRKMKSSVLLAPGLFRRIERTRTIPEMFVAIIICLRGHRYKRRLYSYIPLFLSQQPDPNSVSSSLALLISSFCLLIFLPRFATRLARASFRSSCLPTNVRGIVRSCPSDRFARMGENPEADGEENP